MWSSLIIKALLSLANVILVSQGLEVTEGNACDICACSPGPSLHPKELVLCKNWPAAGEEKLEIVSLPAFVRGIHIVGAAKGVAFERGSIRVKSKSFVFKVTVDGASEVEFRAKSTTILVNNGTVHFDLRNVENLAVKSRAVSSTSGNFELHIQDSNVVHLQGQAFDVINSAQLRRIKRLILEPSSLKPNVALNIEVPFAKAVFEDIDSLPSLPMEAFSSANVISFLRCSIGDVESTAFSGVSVYNISFESCRIERIHSSAFPEQALVQNLAFVNCSLTSMSENAVSSAISTLTMTRTNLSAISTEAFNHYVAKVHISDCVFKTLVRKSFAFRTWNSIVMQSNSFMFLEDSALLGISEPNSRGSVFQFSDNRIDYANRNGLKIDFPASLNSSLGNFFQGKDCACDFDKWLMVVTGERDLKSPSEWAVLLLNSSLCRIPNFAQGCFDSSDSVHIALYSDKMCSLIDSSLDCSIESAWDVIREQIEVSTNKGILLIVLIFVLGSTLVVGIVTLLRWIVYTIQMRKFRHSHDWSFTKIEEQQTLKELIEEEAIELEDSPSPTQHYESLAHTSHAEVMSTDKQASKGINNEEEEPLMGANLPEMSVGKPPTQTGFYDEMISYLQEKLEDPENYATVVDDTDMVNTTTLYMDPTNLQQN